MKKPKQLKLTIIIPVYNEERTIKQVIEKVRKVKLEPNLDKEIILVDDASTDQSKGQILSSQKLDNKSIKVHFSLINIGKGAAVRLALKYATGDIIIIQDADLELDPNDYQKILDPILSGTAQVVYGSRFLGKNPNIPIKTRVVNWALTMLINILYGSNLTDMETAYKAFRAEVVNGMKLRALEFEFEPEITTRILQKGLTIHEVPIHYRPRTKNEGKKINFIHGIEALYTILKYRIT
jgi:glycosyltransferase involved in cell wall biosynthesis